MSDDHRHLDANRHLRKIEEPLNLFVPSLLTLHDLSLVLRLLHIFKTITIFVHIFLLLRRDRLWQGGCS